MRVHAVQCVRCLRTSVSAAQKQAVDSAVPLHARPQPHAGPSKPSLLSRVASKQRSTTLPHLVSPRLAPSPIENLERALQSNHLTLAYEIQRHLDQERIPLSTAQHSRIERAWAIHSARRRRPPLHRLPSYLLQSTASPINQQTLLDLIHHSLRSPPPHPPLTTLLSKFPTPPYNPLQILHQFLHPDLPSHLHPPPSTIQKHKIQPTTKTLLFYLRNLSRKRNRSKRAIALVMLFEKRWKVAPDQQCWRLLVRFLNQEGDKEVAEWVLRKRGGLGLRAFLERRRLVKPVGASLAMEATNVQVGSVSEVEALRDLKTNEEEHQPISAVSEPESGSLIDLSTNETNQASLTTTPIVIDPSPTATQHQLN